MKLLAIPIAMFLIFSFPTSTSNHIYEFLIITHQKFLKDLQKFANFKEEHGIKTKIVTLNEIYDGKYFKCMGKDKQEKIKYFIKNAYDEWNIKYVLLVGSAKYFPIRYSYLNDRSSTWEYERKFISDLYYADLYDENGSFSSWDSNGNGYYGEYEHEINDKKYNDKVDLKPEVAIARLACRNEIELKNALNKIINYESNNKLLLIGGDSYPNDPCGNVPEGEYLEDEIANEMNEFDAIKLYPPKNSMEISKYINDGVAFAIFEGAGAQHLWATHDYDDEKWIYYYGWNIRILKNKIYPIVLTSGARLAKFDENRECFNWIFVASRHGGVASIGSTGLCWTGHGKNVTKFYLGNLHLRLLQSYKNSSCLGDMWKNAITSYLDAFHWKGKVEKAFHMKAAEELELFGDPTMPLYHISYCINENTLYVGGNGSNNYTSIQDAINDAMPGDKIIVLSGKYFEDVNVDKKLTIISKNATLIGHFDLNSPSTINGFIINGENYSIKCNYQNFVIENNKIKSYYGILINNASNGKILKNNFECKYAVFMKNSPYCNFYENLFANNWYGIWAEYSGFLNIESNNFSSNRWYTLWLDRCDRSIIKNNSFYKNWYSIFLYHTNDCLIKSNEILYNEHGPQIVFSSNNNIEENNISHNEHYGVYVDNESKENEILRNNIMNNAYNARDDGKNKWDYNYWSDYIGNKFKILWMIGFPKYIPEFNFDWHPTLHPYKI